MLLLLTAVTPFQSEIRFQMGAELRTGILTLHLKFITCWWCRSLL